VKHGVTIALALAIWAAASTGTLSIESEPAGAAVYVDGAFAGETPLNLTTIDAGDHRVRLVKDGYLENARIVSVTTGKTSRVHVRLTARASSAGDAPQDQGSGISSGPPPNRRKWIYLGAAGAGAAATTAALAARNRAPTLTGITASPPGGLVNGTPVSFTAQALRDPDNDPLTYSWEFGDGATATTAAPVHVYAVTGTFSPKLTVSDGKHTASAGGSVTIRSLSGTWAGPIVGNPGTPTVTATFVLTQSGTSISGTYSDAFGPGTIGGTVATSVPIVTMTISQQGFTPFVFTGTPNATVDAVSGVLNQSGFMNTPITITRR
jgi:phage baseplate assembly protein gpV